MNSIEFFIDNNYNFVPFELQSIKGLNSKYRNDILGGSKSFYEITSINDLEVGDKKKDILINIPCDIDRAENLLKIIQKLKRKIRVLVINKVYVRYGLLSHPSILLREAGFKVCKLSEGYITKVL